MISPNTVYSWMLAGVFCCRRRTRRRRRTHTVSRHTNINTAEKGFATICLQNNVLLLLKLAICWLNRLFVTFSNKCEAECSDLNAPVTTGMARATAAALSGALNLGPGTAGWNAAFLPSAFAVSHLVLASTSSMVVPPYTTHHNNNGNNNNNKNNNNNNNKQ